MEEPGKDGPEQHSHEQHSQRAHGQRRKAHQLARKRVDIPQKLGKRAQEAQDRDGADQDPAVRDDRSTPAKEQ